MTYTVTITEPGAEPVTVSLEWTTEAPKVPGWYWAMCSRKNSKLAPSAQLVTLTISVLGERLVSIYGETVNIEIAPKHRDRTFVGWLGPLPMPPKE